MNSLLAAVQDWAAAIDKLTGNPPLSDYTRFHATEQALREAAAACTDVAAALPDTSQDWAKLDGACRFSPHRAPRG